MIEQDVINKCIMGDRQAYASFYNTCAPYAYAIIKNYISDTHFRKDALQEVFAELFLSLSSYDESRGTFKSWLSKITVHTTIDLQRKKLKLYNNSEIDAVKYVSDDVNLDIQDKDMEQVHLLLQDMPDGYKTIFLLKQVEEYSHQKIGRLLDITPETSRSQLNRAKRWIKKNMVKIKNLTPNEVI